MVHWCHTVCGPVGNCGGSHQKDQSSFNSLKWLRSQGASLGGFVVHTGEYVNCIQIIGNQEQLDLGMLAGEGYKVLISSALTVLELVNGGGGGGERRAESQGKMGWAVFGVEKQSVIGNRRNTCRNKKKQRKNKRWLLVRKGVEGRKLRPPLPSPLVLSNSPCQPSSFV